MWRHFFIRGLYMVHQYKLLGCNIVLDTCSGSVHAVDDIGYDIIALYENSDKETIIAEMNEKYSSLGVASEEIEECYDQITELVAQNKLFTPDSFEAMAGELKRKTAGVVKALCLHIAHTCNLNCEYCFASQGKYHGERAIMSFETGKRALEYDAVACFKRSLGSIEEEFFVIGFEVFEG